MTLFVTLTRHAAGKPIRVNVAAVAYLDVAGDATNVAFGSGETLRVSETPEEIERRIDAAIAFYSSPPTEAGDPAAVAAKPTRRRP